MTLFSKKWSNRKATRKRRGTIQSQDQELRSSELGGWGSSESQLPHAKGPLPHLTRTTTAPGPQCPPWRLPCPTLRILQCHQFTFTYLQYSQQNQRSPAAASEPLGHPCGGRRKFPQRAQPERGSAPPSQDKPSPIVRQSLQSLSS